MSLAYYKVMTVLFLYLSILPIVVLMIANGVRGRGYKVTFKLPPEGSKYWMPARIGMLLYVVTLLALVVLIKTNEYRSQGLSASAIITSITIYVALMALVVFLAIRKYKSKS